MWLTPQLGSRIFAGKYTTACINADVKNTKYSIANLLIWEFCGMCNIFEDMNDAQLMKPVLENYCQTILKMKIELA